MSERLAPGKARVQYIACRDELEDLLKRGETLAGAYQILFDKGTITIPYKSLHRLHSGATRLRTVIKQVGNTAKNDSKFTNAENTKELDSINVEEKSSGQSSKTIHAEKKSFIRPNDTNGV